jgi:pyruvate dehydrogenase (quinone)
VKGIRIEDAGTCGEVLRQALETTGPILVEAVVDGNEPPLPPKVTFEQTRHMVEALLRGTPNAGKIARQLARDTVRQLT